MRKAASNGVRMILTAGEPVGDALAMPGRPYRSVLKPFVELIRQYRRADKSWQEIADLLAKEKGVKVTGRAVNKFFASMRRRTSWPLGMEPQPQGTGAAPSATQGAAQAQASGGVFGTVRGPLRATEADPIRGSRSQLFAHLSFIAEQRQAGESWRQIAEALAGRGLKVSHQAVSDYFKRTRAREVRRLDETSSPAAPVQAEPDPFPAAARSAPAPAARSTQAEPDPFAGTDALDTLAPLPRRNRSKPQN